MTTFIVEVYVSESSDAELRESLVRMRDVARELGAEGRAIRHVRSTFVPKDETCFHRFEAASADYYTRLEGMEEEAKHDWAERLGNRPTS